MPTAKSTKKKALPPKKAHASLSAKSTAPAKKVVAIKMASVSQNPFSVRRLYVNVHLVIALGAISVLTLLGIADRVTFSTLLSRAEEPTIATIGIEHDGPLSLGMLIARKDNAGYASIINRSDALVHISVPSDWSRSEVTGALIAEVTSELPVFGFTRWTLPARAGMKMLLAEAPDALLLDSTSSSSAAIDLQTVDLGSMQSTRKVVLLQKQVLVQLWQAEDDL